MMPTKMTCASLSRISDLEHRDFDTVPLDRNQWDAGDYVVGEVIATSHRTRIELSTGRMIEVAVGDHVVGAFGVRAATQETVGSWKRIGNNNQMQALTSAGIFGRVTSRSSFQPSPIDLIYRGHAHRDRAKLRMIDFVTPSISSKLTCPVCLLIGTSMSSGKTTSARVIIRRLKRMGLRVIGAKLTGAGRYRDVLSMSDAGADAVFDFVDAGLSSTVCDEAVYRSALRNLLGHIADAKPDFLVAEAGASPLEPYNGNVAVDELRDLVRCTVLCASDPYAVVGVTKGFGFEPDLVAGLAASTSAGVEVIEKLAGQPALNLLDVASHSRLDKILTECLGLQFSDVGIRNR